MPEISVIVPVYNVENKIRRCVDSILAQTFTDFELILVDDGSPDRSGEICDEYAGKDTRIKVIHQKNKGAAAARNIGIRKAIGKYIGFVDSDDYVGIGFLSTLYQVIILYDSNISMCCMCSVTNDGTVYENNHRFSDGTILDTDRIKTELYRDIFYNTNTAGYFSLCNKLFKRDMLSVYNLLIDESMSFGEDMLFVMECLKYSNSIAFSDESLYYYEQLSTGLFSKYRKRFIDDIMKCYNSLIEQTKPDDEEDDRCLDLSVKYWNYLDRHIAGIVEHEKNKKREIKNLFQRDDVSLLLNRMASLSHSEAEQYHIAENELKPARSVAKNRIHTAVLITLYQFDNRHWLRRVRCR